MIAPALEWRVQRFDEFDPATLYALLAARVDVFVVEQACPYPELDGRDADALHVSAWQGDVPAGYARLVPPGGRFVEPSIGRVLTTAAFRGTGLGRVLMQRAIETVEAEWPGRAIRVSAQQHLERFYASLGFVADSAVYDEDGIPHVDMLRAARA
ncbi:GNAT family N-acetyltransferase [Wenzhouxiangella sp. XN79A]|nr:GNAT family N-acetyltransferase [Wenzhouxiangella sp. XN79A]